MIGWSCASSGEDPRVSSDDADRRIAVILAADVAGYSRLVALDEATTLAALSTYQRCIVSSGFLTYPIVPQSQSSQSVSWLPVF